MTSFVLVFRSGGDFRLEHAVKLAVDITTHAPEDILVQVFTDEMPIAWSTERVLFRPLIFDWPGWWAKIEAFRAHQPAIYLDLDTVVRGDLAPLVDLVENLGAHELLMLNEWPATRRDMASGVMGWNSNTTWITAAFADLARGAKFSDRRIRGHLCPELEVAGKKYWGDQVWIQSVLPREQWTATPLQMNLPGFAESYKLDLHRDITKATGSLVLFHGEPRPWEIGI